MPTTPQPLPSNLSSSCSSNMTSSPPNILPRPRKQLVITDLPPEILRRISSFLTRDLFTGDAENLYSAHALLQTCTRFYKAVLESNNYKIILSHRIFHHQLPHLETLFSLFKRNIRQIQLDYDLDCIPHMKETPFYDNFKLGETMLFSVLISHTLRTALIPDRTEYLYAIRHAKSLKNLFIRLYREPSPDIGKTITSLPLTHLSVSNEDFFNQCPGGYPCLINVFRFNGGIPMYRTKCAGIVSLGFCCRCADHDHYSLTAVLAAFPNLRDLQISARVSPSVAPFFKHMDNIQLDYIENVGEICETLGYAVTSLRTDALLTSEEFKKLACCQKLVVLKCRLIYDAESVLNKVLRSLPHLRYLQIRWGDTPKVITNGACPEGCVYSVRSMTVSRLVRTTRLSHLEIVSVRMSLKELLEVFKIMGTRAQLISINNVLIHGESTFRAMVVLMDTAAVRNRNLRQLHLRLVPSSKKLGFEEDQGPSRGFKLYQALDRIRRLIPWLRWGDLKENIDDLVNYAYVMKDIFKS